jgi:hypothetical protein
MGNRAVTLVSAIFKGPENRQQHITRRLSPAT